MTKRRAILIGVSEYESNAFASLPVVRRDLEILHAALEKSDYAVRTIGTEDSDQTGRTKIVKALRNACRDAKGVEVLLLYFSGHGIHYEGRDYLIPSDADFDDLNFEEYLITPDAINQAIDKSEAKTILFVIDACRQSLELGIKNLRLVDWSLGRLRKASHRSYVLAFACSSGEFSQYVTQKEDSFSLFTKAFADALDREHPSTTIGEVFKATQQSLDHLVQTHQKKRQKIRITFEADVEASTLARVICNGASAYKETESDLDTWSYAALSSSLWPKDVNKEGTSTYQLKQQASKIIGACWQRWKVSQKMFPNDAWRDENLPIRATERLGLLIIKSNPPIQLSPAEIAVVVTIPFLREAVLADGLIKASECEPLSLDEDLPKQGFRFALDKIYQGQPRFIRKAKRLQEQGLSNEKDAVMTWLLHRCLLRNLEVWQPEDQGGCISPELITVLEEALTQRQRLVKDVFTKERLLELARCMFADVERIDRDDLPGALSVEETVHSDDYRDEYPIREQLLAYLLKLTGLLAIDIRTLSDVIADHIGLSDPLTPQESIETIRQADWQPAGEGRKLVVYCHHPAVDMALIDHVETANSIRTHIFRKVAAKAPGLDVCKGLPTRLLPDGIKPLKVQGIPAYQTPHVNFQLAHDEVRELLMGEQLYGDPSLAIREMYQNALDACRYKEARLEYLKKTNQYEGNEDNWEGEIIFRQDVDEQGREYIECEDNGIGMSMQHLSRCFAKAGKRFADLPEFIEEQSEWSKHSIELYPNSQFGVGVLSYFMLSDEIEVETCRLDRKGHLQKTIQVRIPGSSGLFRIQGLKNSRQSGTRIRLYLNKTSHNNRPISCLITLKRLVWVADYKLIVQEKENITNWMPGVLTQAEIDSNKIRKTHDKDFWWVAADVSHHGYNDYPGIQILSDGIATSSRFSIEFNHNIAVINLKKKWRPKLTIDRKRVHECDSNHISKTLSQNINILGDWDKLNILFILKLDKHYPSLANSLKKHLANHSLNFTLCNSYKKSICMSKIGFFADDAVLLTDCIDDIYEFKKAVPSSINIGIEDINSLEYAYYNSKYLMAHRLYKWHISGIVDVRPSAQKCLPYIENIENLDNFRLGDSKILSDFLDESVLNNEFIPASIFIFVSKTLDESIFEVYRRFQRLSRLRCFTLKIPEIKNLDFLKEIKIDNADYILLSDDLDGKYPISKNKLLAPRIMLGARKLKVSVDEVIRKLEKFEILGIDITGIEKSALCKNLVVDDISALVISRNLNSTFPIDTNRVSISSILLTSRIANIPFKEILQKLNNFQPLGLKLPTIEDNESLSQEIDLIDAALISQRFKGLLPITNEIVTTPHIIFSTQALNISLQETIERFCKLSTVGIKNSIDNGTRAINISEISEISFLLLSDGFNGKTPRDSNEFGIFEIIRASQKLNLSIDEIFSHLLCFRSLGLQIFPEHRDYLNTISINEEDYSFIEIMKDRKFDLEKSNYSEEEVLWILIYASNRLQKTVMDILLIWRKFKYFGIDSRVYNKVEIMLEEINSLTIDKADIFIADMFRNACKNKFMLMGKVYDVISPHEILSLSFDLDLQVQEIVDRCKKLAPLFKLTLPDGEPEKWLTYTDMVSK